MKYKTIIDELNLMPGKGDISIIKKENSAIIESLKDELKKQKIDANIFLGGSFAKGTIVKKSEYDIDIFVRFDEKYDDFTLELEKVVKQISKKLALKYIRLHGSRDYFKILKKNIIFEIIPVTRIKKPKEARNVTDLSYFHVNYVKKNTNNKIANEIVIAKTFCRAHGVYGAESYIQGFSGYALECLIIYYKSFEKMLRELVKVKEKIVIDPDKKYKNKDDVLINLNESKIHSPVILVDPTWKERNVLAALSSESFQKFQKAAKEFLKRPNIGFFEENKISSEEIKREAKKANAEFLAIDLETNKQAGDIAGTKLKKFTNFILFEIERCFDIIKKEFVYDDCQNASLYLILNPKKEIIKIGPPINMKKECAAFRKNNKNTFVKEGHLCVRIKIINSAKRFLSGWVKKYQKKVDEMGITRVKTN